jgi:hypothetical protein
MKRMCAKLLWLLVLLAGLGNALAFYNPTTGRWLSRDPIGERGGVGLYGFLRNDSVRRIDVLGLSPIASLGPNAADLLGTPRCYLDLFYEFFGKDEVNLGQPVNTVFVKSMNDVVHDITSRVKTYNADGICCKGSCIQRVRVSHHGEGPGRLPLGGGITFDPANDNPTGKELAPKRQELYEEYMKAKAVLESFVNAVKPKLCRSSTIEFIVCGAKSEHLQSTLDGMFGPNVNVSLSTGNCSPLGPFTVPLP